VIVRAADHDVAPAARPRFAAWRTLLVGVALAFLPATALAQTTYTWNVASGSWATAASWTPSRTTPSASDILVFNGSTFATATVTNVPTQTIGRLRIINGANVTMSAASSVTLTITGGATPNLDIVAGTLTLAGTQAIMLTLGSTATANIAGNITLSTSTHQLLSPTAGAIQFVSGGSMTTGTGYTGSPFGTTGTAGVAVFNSGATYTHNAGNNPFGLAAPNARVVFNTGSTVVYRTSSGFSADGRTYGNLTLQNNISVSSSGANSFQFQTLNIESGSSFTHTGSSASSIIVKGDILVAGTGNLMLNSGTGGVQVNGGITQTVGGGGTGTVTFGGNATVASGTTLQVNRALTSSGGGITVNGTFQINQGGNATGGNTFIYGAGAALVFNNSSGSFGVNSSSTFWPAVNSPTNVSVLGAGGITMNSGATRTVSGTLRIAGPVTNANLLTASGTLQFDATGSVTGVPTYTGTSTLLYTSAKTVGPEWGTGSVVGPGVPFNVTITAGAGTVTMPNSDRALGGALTITSGTLAMNATSGNLSIGGNWSNAGTFTVNGRTVTFTGPGTQTLSRTGGETFATLALNKSGGSVQLLSAVTSTAASGNSVEFNGTTDVLDLNGQSLTMARGFGGTDANGSLRGNAASNLVVNGPGAGGTMRFVAGTETLNNLTVNRTGAGADLGLGSALTVNGTLTLTSGTITTGANTITLGPAGTLTRTSGWINGKLGMPVGTGSPTIVYEVGSAAVYTPIDLSFQNVTVAGSIAGGVVATDHPNIATSGLQPTKSVNRYYSIVNTGVTLTSYSATLRFVAGDIDAGTLTDSVEVRRFSGGSWNFETTGTRTSTSTQVTGVTAFGDLAIGEPVFRTVTSSAGPNGTIAPLGAQIVKDGRDLTFTMFPNTGFQVDSLLVDGVTVGNPTTYTLVHVTADHTVRAVFRAGLYPVTVVINGSGTVTRDQPGPLYPYQTFLGLTATPLLGNRFTGWTRDVFTQFNPVGFSVDSTMIVQANFERMPLDYTRSTFTATFNQISTGTGAVRLFSAADDSTASIPLPFSFVFSGIPYTTSNFLAVNANGFGYFSRSNITESSPSLANNVNLYTLSTPNSVLAPWYDNLSVGAVGTNPAGSVLYQTQGTTGNRTLTVQWTNVSSYNTATSGQPRRVNFQLILYEASQSIEFRYGAATGSTYNTLESASIAIEDSTGGNGNYIDGVTGSRATNQGMLTTNKWPTRFLRYFPGGPAAITGGTYGVGVGQTYPNVSEAVADVNHRGISGPVTFNLTDAVYDTSSSTGRTIFPLLIGPIPFSTAANSVTFTSSAGATLRYRGTESGNCGNQVITNAIGATNEPILALVGADYVNLKNLSFEGGNLVDRGVLVIPSSTLDGSQFNTLESINTSMNRANTSSIGVQQSMPSTPAGPAGTNSNNHYYNLHVSNSYAGVSLAGSANEMDSNNEIGVVNGGSTLIGAGFQGDIGNGTVSTFGIRANGQADLKISNCDVGGMTGIGTGSVDGIVIDNLSTATQSNGVCSISSNVVHDLLNANASAGRVTGIRVNLTSNPASVGRVFNNFVYNLNSSSTVTSTRRVVGIFAQDAGGGTDAVHQVDFNSVRIAPAGLACTNTCFEVGTTTGPVVFTRNNLFTNFSGSQTASAKHYCWVTPTANQIGVTGSVSDRNLLHVNNSVNGFTGLAGGIDKATLADWQAVASNDGASNSPNPQYMSPTNLHISTTVPTPVERAGSYFGGAITWVGIDIDNNTRSATQPDLGADEGNFQLLTSTDVSASTLIEPAPGTTKIAGSTFTPQAVYENEGTTPLTNIPVRYRILGPSPSATVVYNQPFTIPSLAPGANQTVTYPSTSIAIGGIYTIQAIASLAGDLNVVNDTLSATLEIAAPLSGTFSVGSAQPPPFNSLTNMVTRLNSVGVAGPVVLRLTDPSYGPGETFPLTINLFPGASATNLVTIRPAPGVTSTITGTTLRAIFQFNGADYVTLDGSNTPGGSTRDLTITNSSTSPASAVIWGQTSSTGDATTNITLKNLVLVGNDNNQTLVGAGFASTTISFITPGGTGNNNNAVIGCEIKRTQYGVFSSGLNATTKNTGTTVSQNKIDATGPDAVGKGGIYLRFEDNVTLAGNRIGNITSTSASPVFGISLGLSSITSTSWAGDDVTNATVRENLIRSVQSTNATGMAAAGIAIAETPSGTTTLTNNMISGVLSPATDPDVTVGILIGGGGATRLYFNSVFMSGLRSTGTSGSFALAVGGTNPVLELKDNVLVNTQLSPLVGEGYAIALNYAAPYSNLSSDRNDIFTGTANYAVIGGFDNSPDGDRPTISFWRAETGQDATSIAADPQFVSSSDLHIGSSGSPLSNIGLPIAGVTTDIDGEPGSRTTTPDIGADEFVTYPLTTTAIGNGSIARNPDFASYISGSVVQLTPNPAAFRHFVGWGGDASGTTVPLPVLMDRAKTITATFVLDSLAVVVSSGGNGTAAKSPNQPLYQYGTAVSLSATPSVNYHFDNWTGDTVAVGNPLNLIVTRDRNLVANFAINTFPVTVTAGANGSITRNPDLTQYPYGSSVTLTGVPAVGYHFLNWTGDTTTTTNPLSVIVTRARTMTANFAINQYTLGVTSSGNGSVAKAPNQALYNHGTQVTLTGTPAVGYHFLNWSGDTTATTNPLIFNITGNKAIVGNFEINQYTLNLTSTGEGTAAKNPNQATYPHGSVVQLTGTPNAGHSFSSWAGDASGSTNPLNVTMNGNKNITARFTLAINTAVTGTGTVTKSPNQTAYAPGTAVTVTANAGSGFTFNGWTGDTTAATNPLNIVVTSVSRNLTANFINVYTLDLTVIGNGTLAKNPNLANYTFGAAVTVTATPNSGQTFIGWAGDTSGTANPLNVVITRNRNIIGLFTYSLTTNTVGNGTVSRNPNAANYAPGTQVTLTANAATNNHFVSWSGDTTATSNPLVLPITGNRTVTANFAIDTHTLTLNAGANGTVSKNPDLPQYNHGASVTVTATPDPGYHFVGWTGDTTATTNPMTFNLVANRVITSTFAINTYTVALSAGTGGTAAKNPNTATYDHGTSVTLTATPDVGFNFLNWAGDTSTTTNPLTFPVVKNRTINAVFAIRTYTLSANPSGSGTVTRNPNQASYNHGTTVVVTATPGTGWHFLQWTGDASGSTNPLSVLMDGPKDITAVFEINQYALTLSVPSGNGVIAAEPNQPLYPDGTLVDLIPVPNTGYRFVSWGGDASGSATLFSLLMNAPKSVTATFAIKQFPINTSVVGTGSIVLNPNQALYNYGTVVTMTATTDTSRHFVRWGGKVDGRTSPMQITITDTMTVSAFFASNIYTVNVTTQGGTGTITRDPNQTTMYMGGTIGFTATPAAGFQFAGWHGDVNTLFNPVSARVDSNVNIIAQFVAAGPPVINLTIVGQGSVSRNPDLPSYPIGSTVTMIATPSPGWHFVGYTGEVVTPFPGIAVWMDRDKNFTATFSSDKFALATSVVGGGTVVRLPDSTTYTPNTTVQVTANASAGWHFMSWAGDTTTISNPIQVLMNRDRSVVARFGHTLTTAVADGGASISTVPAQNTVLGGDTIQVTPHAKLGYRFTGWSGDATGNAVPLLAVMTVDKSITANFALVEYVLDLFTDGQGTISRTPVLATYPNGSNVIVSATPAPGWHFLGWMGSSDPVKQSGRNGPIACPNCLFSQNNPLNVVMESDRSVTAVFEDNAFAFQADAEGSGAVAQQWVPQDGPDTIVLLTAQAEEGWRFVSWSGDVMGSENPLRIDLSGPVHATAKFAKVVATGDPVAANAALTVKEFALSSVHPNPTNGPAQIEFALPYEASIRITVIDVQGRETAVVADGVQPAGRHLAVWNGRTAAGDAGNGIYFIRYRTPAGVFTKRIVLAR
jgi:uncharacterized repeat protein (TIGR02543 family)